MIVINTKLAKEAVENGLASGRVNGTSNPYAWLLQCTVHLNRVYDARKEPGKTCYGWPAAEFAAAEALHWIVAFLERSGCEDIERLLRDVSRYRRQHPDKAGGPWPYE